MRTNRAAVPRSQLRRGRTLVGALLALTLALGADVIGGPSTTVAPSHHPSVALTSYPSGTVRRSEPSGLAPPTSSSLAGFTLDYVNDFLGKSVLGGWGVYSGVPGSDPGGQFSPGHVSVSGGLLHLSSWSDPLYGGTWVTGGLCHCGFAHTYGAFFVRTRATGPGPTVVELLWPANNQWPPEIDFAETDGGVGALSATVHWGASNNKDQRRLAIDLTQWHTFGVVWTPGQLLYVVDGRVWGTVSRPSEIPNIPMTLDLQQQTWCLSSWACPLSPQEMLVDWVAEFKMTGPLTVNVGPFSLTGPTLSAALQDQVQSAAADLAYLHCASASVLGYANPTTPRSLATSQSLRWAQATAALLRADVSRLTHRVVTTRVQGLGATNLVGPTSTTLGQAQNRRVVVTTCSPG